MRGKKPLKAAWVQAQIAADRNAHKPGWRQEPLRNLFEKLDEEVDEYHEAVMSGDLQRVREELGDLIWTATMIADHDAALGDWEPEDEPQLQKGVS